MVFSHSGTLQEKIVGFHPKGTTMLVHLPKVMKPSSTVAQRFNTFKPCFNCKFHTSHSGTLVFPVRVFCDLVFHIHLLALDHQLFAICCSTNTRSFSTTLVLVFFRTSHVGSFASRLLILTTPSTRS